MGSTSGSRLSGRRRAWVAAGAAAALIAALAPTQANAAKAPKAGDACSAKQVGKTTKASDGSTLTCAKQGKAGKWAAAPATTAAPAATAAATATTAASAAAPKRGGSMVVGTVNVITQVNALIASGVAVAMPATQIFASLLRYPNGLDKPEGDLAESWSVAKDGLSVTVKLRPNLKFHDGSPITSEDVAFSILASRDNHPFQSMFAPVTGVDTPDALTAVVKLSRPHPAILTAMSGALLPIMPKKYYGDGQPLRTHPRNTANIVGSGPFKVVDFKPGPGGILRLARFDGYWAKDRPYLDELIIKHYPDEATLSLALEKGEVQLAGFGSLDSTNRLKKNSSLKVSDADNELGAQVFIVFNTQSKVFARKEARQAVAYGIDKKQIIDNLLPGIKEETGPIPAGTRFYAKDGINTYPYDAVKSAAALRQSGNGLGMDFTLDYIPGADELIKAPAEVIKAQLAKVGINVTLRASPDTAAWATRVAAGNFEATITSLFMWGDPVIGTNRMFLTDNIRPVIFANNSGWARASVDDLMTKAGGELDATKRKAMYVEFQRQIMDEVPHYYLWEAPIKVVSNKSVQNPPEGAWTILSSMDQVWLK